MPRRRVAAKREVLPDPIYNSVTVTKFINGLMWEGKKAVAEQIFYSAMAKIGERTGEDVELAIGAAGKGSCPRAMVEGGAVDCFRIA